MVPGTEYSQPHRQSTCVAAWLNINIYKPSIPIVSLGIYIYICWINGMDGWMIWYSIHILICLLNYILLSYFLSQLCPHYLLAIPCHTPTVATPINHDFQIYNVTMFYAYDYRSPIHSTCSTPSSNLHDIPISNDTLTGKNQDIPIEKYCKHG